MWIKEVLMGVTGLGAGTLVAAGVFALISSIGLIPRMAGKTHTGSHVKKYEMAVLFGGTFGNIMNIFEISVPLGVVGLISFGLFAGIFVGCLATSLAESLDATAIFARRVRLHKGMGVIILSVAMGKLLASILFFYLGWYYICK